jgi:hypothetical protein
VLRRPLAGQPPTVYATLTSTRVHIYIILKEGFAPYFCTRL